MAFICSSCGKEHTEWPAKTFLSPTPYFELSQEAKDKWCKLSKDYCYVQYEDHNDLFIRVTMTQKVIDHCQDLNYGLWVALNAEDYTDYMSNFDRDDFLKEYNGLLANTISPYKNTLRIPVLVRTRTGNKRPEIIPVENFEHPFTYDYYRGIKLTEAENRVLNG